MRVSLFALKTNMRLNVSENFRRIAGDGGEHFGTTPAAEKAENEKLAQREERSRKF